MMMLLELSVKLAGKWKKGGGKVGRLLIVPSAAKTKAAAARIAIECQLGGADDGGSGGSAP